MSSVSSAIDCIWKIESMGLRGVKEPFQDKDYALHTLANAFSCVEASFPVGWVLMDPYTFGQFSALSDFVARFDAESDVHRIRQGIRGELWGATVLTTDSLCPGICYVISDPNAPGFDDYYFQCIVFPTPPREPAICLGNYTRLDERDRWLLLRQPQTRAERWVSKNDIMVSDVATAFYDADPTWTPG